MLLSKTSGSLSISGGKLHGPHDMNENRITRIPSPIDPNDPATKDYVDSHGGGSSSGVTKL